MFAAYNLRKSSCLLALGTAAVVCCVEPAERQLLAALTTAAVVCCVEPAEEQRGAGECGGVPGVVPPGQPRG